jgi:hypothetical protein
VTTRSMRPETERRIASRIDCEERGRYLGIPETRHSQVSRLSRESGAVQGTLGGAGRSRGEPWERADPGDSPPEVDDADDARQRANRDEWDLSSRPLRGDRGRGQPGPRAVRRDGQAQCLAADDARALFQSTGLRPAGAGRLSHGCSRCLALQHLESRHRDAGDRSVQSAAVFCRAAAAFRSMSGSAGCGWNGGLSGHTPDFARPDQHLERPHAGDGILPSHWQGSCLVPANGVDEVPRMKSIHGGLSRRGP